MSGTAGHHGEPLASLLLAWLTATRAHAICSGLLSSAPCLSLCQYQLPDQLDQYPDRQRETLCEQDGALGWELGDLGSRLHSGTSPQGLVVLVHKVRELDQRSLSRLLHQEVILVILVFPAKGDVSLRFCSEKRLSHLLQLLPGPHGSCFLVYEMGSIKLALPNSQSFREKIK